MLRLRFRQFFCTRFLFQSLVGNGIPNSQLSMTFCSRLNRCYVACPRRQTGSVIRNLVVVGLVFTYSGLRHRILFIFGFRPSEFSSLRLNGTQRNKLCHLVSFYHENFHCFKSAFCGGGVHEWPRSLLFFGCPPAKISRLSLYRR